MFQDAVQKFHRLFPVHCHNVLKGTVSRTAKEPENDGATSYSLGSFLGVTFVFHGVLIQEIKHGDNYRINWFSRKIQDQKTDSQCIYSLFSKTKDVRLPHAVLDIMLEDDFNFKNEHICQTCFFHNSW